ncbi:hypothetical protein [Nocardioides panzhihuensis]|uniref:Uncharacterized protein n=1 Tax=Nocardioides panzhihuensis TaxID=860243 RepID=A0A7Z0DQQ7_9ACTN|nr:hypothetical protein [Nocardioides panzhihuensis]NYI79937.1 hypothetical protein [Nocardioides panzhihuensis]
MFRATHFSWAEYAAYEAFVGKECTGRATNALVNLVDLDQQTTKIDQLIAETERFIELVVGVVWVDVRDQVHGEASLAQRCGRSASETSVEEELRPRQRVVWLLG